MNPQDPLDPNQGNPAPAQPPQQPPEQPFQPISPQTFQQAPQDPYTRPNPAETQPNLGIAPPATQPYYVAPKSNKAKQIMIIVAITIVLTLVAVGSIFAIDYFSGIPLDKYSAKEYSVQVPKGYEKRDDGNTVEFTEQSKDDDTQSSVLVGFERIPGGTNGEAKETFLEFIEKDFAEGAKLSFSNVEKTKGFTTDKTEVDGFEAIRGQGISLDYDGKENGKIAGVVVVGDKGIYQVFVFAHTSDTELAKSVDKIIDSLEIK